MILVLGATGFLGKAVCENLQQRGIDYIPSSLSLGLDLRNELSTIEYFNKIKPKIVINCASYVGGIQYGYKYPVNLFQNNIKIASNILSAAHSSNVEKLINPISNCVYPAKATLFKEDELWEGPMHDSVAVYGFVRKAFIIGAYAYNLQYGSKIVNLVLSNMYGPGDHFEEERSHAIGALIMKFVKAKRDNKDSVTVWGTGNPVREWLHVRDGAEALIRAIDIQYYNGPINIGISEGISIKSLVEIIKQSTGFCGEIIYDTSKPDGAIYKTVDGQLGEKILNWKPQHDLVQGIKETIEWYNNNY